MPNNLENRYNRIYSENETAFGGGKPDKIVEEAANHLDHGTALEVGAGEGRNSFFLARQGFEVTAVDLSEVGLNKLKKSLEENGLDAKVVVGDVREMDFYKDYDLIASTFVLHHLPKEEAVALIRKIQEHTSDGGLNALTTFSKNGDFYRSNPEGGEFYPDEGELRSLYDGWQIIDYNEDEASEALAKKPDGTPMINMTVRILARKPSK